MDIARAACHIRPTVSYWRGEMRIVLAALVVAVSSSASAGDIDRTVFGIELGKPLTLHECAKRKSSGGTLEFYLLPDQINDNCFAHFNKADPPVLEIPLRDNPKIVNARYMPYLKIIDGNVEGIEFKTYGVEREEETFGLLTAKYGQPTRVTGGSAKNLAGAQFTTRDASWSFENLTVIYHSVEGNLTFGRVIVETDKAKALSDAAQRKDDGNRQKF
jgi:hypothetical protein